MIPNARISNFEVEIHPSVESLVVQFLSADLSRERGGFLIGILASVASPYSSVRRAILCPDAPSTAVSLKLRAEEWQLAHESLAADEAEESIVGWFHSHPSIPVRMSSRDKFIQANFFGDNRQLAWIINPVNGEEAWWRWNGSSIDRVSRRASCAAQTSNTVRDEDD